MKRSKSQLAIGGDRLKTRDLMCHNCGRQKRARGYQYCDYCLEYMRPKVRIWAIHENPIPGIDVPEC